MFSGLPPSVGVQLKCHPYSFYWGSRIFPASSTLASSAPSPEPLPGHAAPRAYLPGRPGAAPAPQRRQDPRGSFNNTGTFPRPGAAPAQAPPPAQAPGLSRGSSTSELRQTPPPVPPLDRAVAHLLTGNKQYDSPASTCVAPSSAHFL
ncbi:hypothetical protein NDU88_009028 [Pleurodeles waltl]|uniref:Uncharacterized protein n=1 Tax=Pleurodeles waltl TaxID=8319 RepID=A0AAV7QWH0_PLEWA|nr:hypothetical protein NDU88_009028 [Pleurodeles waltl]